MGDQDVAAQVGAAIMGGAISSHKEDEDAGDVVPDKEYPMPPSTAPGLPQPLGGLGETSFSWQVILQVVRDTEERSPRDGALRSLQGIAAAVQNKRAMWQDKADTRAVILNSAMMEKEEDVEGRCFALGTLWNIAGELANRQDMWDDQDTRVCVVKASQSDNPKVHELGMGILWNLSPKVANAGPVWQDKEARSAIVQAAKSQKADQRQARAFAMAALQNLAEESSNRAEMWADDAGVRPALIEAAQLCNPEDKDLRGRAIGALMNLSVAPANKKHMWDDAAGARSVLLEAANLGPGLDDKSWTCSLAAMWSMAVEQKNRVAMMTEDKVRAAIVKATGPGATANETCKRARERALATLQYLTTDPENKEKVWDDEDIKSALIAATEGPSDGKLKIYALGALWNLSSCQKNQVKMWQDEIARGSVIEVAKDGDGGDVELQERAMAVLWNLSAAVSNKIPMWNDKDGARAALLVVIDNLNHSGSSGRQARQYAFGALRNLADEAGNRRAMWQDTQTRSTLVQATSSQDSGDSVSPKRALKTLCALAYESENAESMWKEESSRSFLINAAQVGDDKDAQLCTLRALQALSVNAANKEAMWQEPDVRKALTQTAEQKSPADHKARICALSIVKNLTTEASNMVSIWGEPGLRTALIKAAMPPAEGAKEDSSASRARAVALGALRNVAVANSNKEPMWENSDARQVIVAAAAVSDLNVSADTREAREHAIAALRHFAVVSDSSTSPEPLWKDHEEAKRALIAAAQFTTEEQSDRKARDYAVAALRHAT